MTKELWINLPVKDISRSVDFFTNIGFSFKPGPGNTEVSASMSVGTKGIVVMLFAEQVFKKFVQHDITDTKQGSEVLLSFDAESREEVDELMKKVKEAGGHVFAEPGESQGWMYGGGFCDPDGHRWNILFMDMSKMPKG